MRISEPERSAAGPKAVVWALRHSLAKMGLVRTARTFARVNQVGGFDCPGCAWPEPGRRHVAEFCENGAKAVAEEATLARAGPELFAAHTVAELAAQPDHWLGRQGRLTHPMYLAAGAERYEPIAWDDAFGVIAEAIDALGSPDQAVFYTSGRTSNEAAFLYQLFARALGTNNLPDCSNMCHESSSAALGEAIGIGKASVTLEDFEQAELILVVGQNPGTNHPRMLSALEAAKHAGATVVAINPLPEAGLIRFKNPQRASGLVGRGTEIADRYLQIRVNGDLALFKALNRLLISDDAVDWGFVHEHCEGFSELDAELAGLSWPDVLAATGLRMDEIDELAELAAGSRRIIVCWAMGLTQHRNAVPTIREIVNFLLLRGAIGKPGAGVCPVRGHSNVQGDRTMGIVEAPTAAFLDALQAEFGFSPPRRPGLDTVRSIQAMARGEVGVFMAMGGNFLAAAPDTAVTAEALRRCRLTVQVSTKLNRSHLVCGERALILPTLGRSERDLQGGGPQVVTVEDSLCLVHGSRGRLPPASEHLLSEVSIVCRLARRVLGDEPPLPWEEFEADYGRIRDRIERVLPGFERFNERLAADNGFVLPHAPRDERRFDTPSGRARLTVNPLEVLRVPPGRLLLQSVRSHDQYNTTIYGLDDRYRGVRGGRRVVFVNPGDLEVLGVAEGSTVDLVGEWSDGVERRAAGFRAVGYPIARGCAAAYFPEVNTLVPLESTAEISNTPTSKSVVVRLEAVA